MNDPWDAAFAKFLDAAGPYLTKIVVAGGWASRLHRLSSGAYNPGFEPLRTEDVDAVAPLELSLDEKPLDQRLKTKGFDERLSSDFRPPVTRYTLPEPKGFEVEFLADQPGGFVNRRSGAEDFTADVAGVTVQKLHYLRILLFEPMAIRVCTDDGFPMDVPEREVLVPNPVSYIVQKLLARANRKDDKRAKDVLYIHDTLQVFGEKENMFGETWAKLRETLPSKWVTRCNNSFRSLSNSNRIHEDVAGAARIASEAGRVALADDIAMVLLTGLSFLTM